jgi:hypothetical protein
MLSGIALHLRSIGNRAVCLSMNALRAVMCAFKSMSTLMRDH